MDSKGEKQGGRAKSRYQGMKAQSSLPGSDPEQFQGFQLSVNKIHRTGEWSAKQTGNSHFLPFLSTVPLEKCALHGIKCTEICRRQQVAEHRSVSADCECKLLQRIFASVHVSGVITV